MPSLRVRRGGEESSSTKLSTSTVNYGDDDDAEKNRRMANPALQSIRYCCKMCFASVLSQVIITFIDRDIWNKFFGHHNNMSDATIATASWIDYVGIFNSLCLLVFGMGMWRISQLYWTSFSDMKKRMEFDHLLELFRTMGWIWGIIGVNLAVASVSLAASLPSYVSSNGPFRLVWNVVVSSRQLSLVVVGASVIGRIAIGKYCAKNAELELRAHDERMAAGNNGQRMKFQQTLKHPMIREAGYKAYYNQAQCAGSFVLLATLELIKWIISFDRGGIVGHYFAASDFLTPGAIAVLLFTLNKSMLRAAIAQVRGHQSMVDNNDEEIYNNLFVAQAGFYNKVAETVKGTTIFRLLPYIVAPIIPPVLNLLKDVPLFAKAFDVLGMQK